MPMRVGLMGLGRIGRNLFRVLEKSDDLRIEAACDVADAASLAYLLRFDTILGRFPGAPGEPSFADGRLHVGGRQIRMLTEEKGSQTVPPWGDLGVDVVVEATGKRRGRAELERHLAAGAKRVILCSPPADPPDATIVFGVNEGELKAEHRIVSAGSPGLAAAAPVLKVLADAFGVERAFLSTVHAFTNQQHLADVPADDPRKGRAAGENIVPQASDAAERLGELLPELAGKITAAAINVPVANGSVADLVCWHSRPVTVEAVNAAVQKGAAGLKRVLAYETDAIVSSDILGAEASGSYDSLATMVLGQNVSKTLTWFDNGWGYAHRVAELIRRYGETVGKPVGKEAAQ
jgi:glyceraldehyde 3-phosphate dehydrogenase